MQLPLGPFGFHLFSSLYTTFFHWSFQIWWILANSNLFNLFARFNGCFFCNLLYVIFGELLMTLRIVSLLTLKSSSLLIFEIEVIFLFICRKIFDLFLRFNFSFGPSFLFGHGFSWFHMKYAIEEWCLPRIFEIRKLDHPSSLKAVIYPFSRSLKW